jgi:DNA-directed RNA polymerase subunit RPC12/RpoP
MNVRKKFLTYLLGDVNAHCQNCGREFLLTSRMRAEKNVFKVRPGYLNIECPYCGEKKLYVE